MQQTKKYGTKNDKEAQHRTMTSPASMGWVMVLMLFVLVLLVLPLLLTGLPSHVLAPAVTQVWICPTLPPSCMTGCLR